MPKVKLNRPPADLIKALILERKNAYRLSDEEMAEKMGVSRGTYQRRIHRQSTADWPLGQITKLCRALDVPIEQLRDATRY